MEVSVEKISLISITESFQKSEHVGLEAFLISDEFVKLEFYTKKN